jgi:hypothetical protein
MVASATTMRHDAYAHRKKARKKEGRKEGRKEGENK